MRKYILARKPKVLLTLHFLQHLKHGTPKKSLSFPPKKIALECVG